MQCIVLCSGMADWLSSAVVYAWAHELSVLGSNPPVAPVLAPFFFAISPLVKLLVKLPVQPNGSIAIAIVIGGGGGLGRPPPPPPRPHYIHPWSVRQGQRGRKATHRGSRRSPAPQPLHNTVSCAFLVQIVRGIGQSPVVPPWEGPSWTTSVCHIN